MNTANAWKTAGALVLMALAAFLLFRSFRSSPGRSEQGFFYDQSKRQLFTAARTAIPPIRGIDGPELDGFRAVVISTNGNARDRRAWSIAYLETYAPELKRQLEAAQASGVPPAISRSDAQQFRLVKRVSDTQWFPMNTPEAEQLLTEWAHPGPDGVTPVVCTP